MRPMRTNSIQRNVGSGRPPTKPNVRAGTRLPGGSAPKTGATHALAFDMPAVMPGPPCSWRRRRTGKGSSWWVAPHLAGRRSCGPGKARNPGSMMIAPRNGRMSDFGRATAKRRTAWTDRLAGHRDGRRRALDPMSDAGHWQILRPLAEEPVPPEITDTTKGKLETEQSGGRQRQPQDHGGPPARTRWRPPVTRRARQGPGR